MSWRSASRPRSESAGGQELQPWEVKSSTTTGMSSTVAGTGWSARAATTTKIIVTARASIGPILSNGILMTYK
jgi:hypothetical protein